MGVTHDAFQPAHIFMWLAPAPADDRGHPRAAQSQMPQKRKPRSIACSAARRPKHTDSDRLPPLAGYSIPTASPSSPAPYSPGIGWPNGVRMRACSSRRGPPHVFGPPGYNGMQ